jgi:hypothetical protein
LQGGAAVMPPVPHYGGGKPHGGQGQYHGGHQQQHGGQHQNQNQPNNQNEEIEQVVKKVLPGCIRALRGCCVVM